MKLLVTGGRTLQPGWHSAIIGVLDAINQWSPVSEIWHGGASGTDASANSWAKDKRIKVICHRAQWDRYGRGAGPRRNQAMIDARPDLVVVFPGGRGTADCASRALDAALDVIDMRKAWR